MKARIRPPKVSPTVLAYGFDPEREEKLAALCRERAVTLRKVEPNELGCTLDALLRGEGVSSDDGDIGEECAVFCGLDERGLDDMLVAMREAGLAVSLKAVLTAINRSWRFSHLAGELKRERAEIERRGGVPR